MGNGTRGIIAAAAAGSVVLLLAGCTGAGGEDGTTSPSAVIVSPSDSPSPAETSAGPTADAGAEAFVGSWGTVADGSPHLVIAADGAFTGNDGCNGLDGLWELEDDGSIEFDDVTKLMIRCTNDQPLIGLDAATVDGDMLTALDDDDNVLIALPRTG